MLLEKKCELVNHGLSNSMVKITTKRALTFAIPAQNHSNVITELIPAYFWSITLKISEKLAQIIAVVFVSQLSSPCGKVA